MVQLSAGQTFAEYTLDGVLGVGGMGSVYLARHPRLPRQVALKLLAHEGAADAELRRRFEQEANAIARLDHPSIVGIHDRGVHDGHLWIAMQYVQGTDASRLDPRQVNVPRALRIVTETAAALDFAHSRGVLHRDVKPANILLSAADTGREERAYLTDFGIARMLDANTQLTSTGTFTATLAYAPPEQLSGEVVDHRADQYSLACTLFALLAGRPPFASTNPGQVVAGHLSQPLPRLSHIRSDVPPLLDDVIARATAKQRDQRFASCTEFVTAAAAALAGQAPAPMPASAQTVVWPQTPHFQNGVPAPLPSTPTTLRPGAIAAAGLAMVAGLIATAGAIRLYFLYSDQKARIAHYSPNGYNSDLYPLTYLGVGTFTAALIALILMGGAGLLLARNPFGRSLIVTGATAYTIAAILGRTTDDRPFSIYGLAPETAVCAIGLIIVLAAAICALSTSVTPPGAVQTPSASAGSRAVLIATAWAAILGGAYAGLAALGFWNDIEYSATPVTIRIVLVGAAITTLLLVGGATALFARAAAGRFMIAIGSIGLLIIGLLRKIGNYLPRHNLFRHISPLPYLGEPAATIFTGVVILLSLTILAGALSSTTARAVNRNR
ncbi:serine/threonine-protein kinase [Nocardia sp. SYP-A9097]|uniref:serine/threonine-protein kinase n=1 Tax=Nocardia sp. SYP-A9097 TaxID=2663237 RepID=UPI00281605DD|nr:serine/threonine-protein kinase [Nocardia sp. SYP-A9097]